MTATASPPAPAPAPGRSLIVLLGSLVMVGPLAVDMYLPSLPDIAAGLAAHPAQVQQTITVFLLGFAVGMLVYGPISDRVGRRPVIAAGLALFLLASLMCAVADSIGTLTLGRFLQAVGGGAASALARAVAKDLFSTEGAARVLSLMAMVMAIAPLAAPTVGGQILLVADWRAIFYVLAAFGAAGLLASLTLLPESLPPSARIGIRLLGAFAAYGRILVSRRALADLASGSFNSAAMFAYITGTPFVYIEFFGVPPQWYGALFGINVVALVIASALNARYLERLGLRRITRLSIAAGAAGGAVLLFAGLTGIGGLWLVAAPLLVVVGIQAPVAANCTARLMGAFPASAGAASALFGAVRFGLGALSSLLVGLLHDGTPLAMCAVVAGCCFLAFAMRFGLDRLNGPGD
ncbi:MAG: Bcr/CflA family multidrug efflux MFS transporter [Thalassobaculum sp.]|uniref:Bcr/CflA family multidrug efflux MFS transporter n=1 Tax=Thalassobaculum sp. TaxID=2022740 RepID=UPI0032F0455E